MGVLNKLKDWLTGKSSKRSKKDKDKIREANRINMGGGVSVKSTQSEIKSSIKKAEAKKKEEQAQAQTSSAFKTTPPSAKATATKSKQASQKKPDPFGADKAFKANSLPKTNSQKLKEQLDKDRAKKLSTPTTASKEKPKPLTIKHQSTALGTLSEKDAKSRLAKMNVEKAQQKERSRAADKLKPIIDAKYGGNTKEVKRRIKSGDYAADPDVAKYETLKHPNMASFGRGALSGTTFGLSELAIAKLPQSEERKEAERLYQANKNKGMESLGELAGSLASFGGTSAATDRLGGKLISKVAPNAAERLAEKQFIKNSAERLVKRGVETNVIGGASEELIKQVGKDKATKIVGALGNDIVQNLTTGAIYDVNKASAQYDVGSKEWWKELGKSALFNAAVTGGIAGGTMATGGRNLVENAADTVAKRLDFRNNYRPVGNIEPKRQLPRIGESIEDRIARVDADNAVKRYPDIEDKYLDYDGTMAAVNRYFDPDATAEAAVDRYYDLDIPRDKSDYKVGLNRKRKTDVSLPNERRVDVAPKAETKQERMLRQADENADAIRAELGAESPEPVKERVTKPEDVTKEYSVQLTRENGRHQKVKVEATSEKEALDKAIGRKKGVKNAKMLGSAEVEPKAELPNTQAAKQETKNINLDDVVNKKREKATFREQFHELASSVKTKISDSLNAFEESNKQYIKSDHQKWLENVGAIDKTRRSGAIAARSIGEGQVKWNGDKIDGTFKAIINGEEKELQNGKSIKQIFDGMDEATEKDFDKYLLLKHAPARIDAGKPIFAGSQYNSKEACEKAAKELLDKHPEFAERAEELYQYTRNEMQNRVDAGLIKQETVNEWREKYPYYVPTGRDGDFSGDNDIWDLAAQLKDNGNTVGAGKIKKATGGDQPIRSIKEQLADATSRNWRDMTLNNLFRKMFSKEAADELATYADGGLEKVLDNTINLSQSKGGKYFAEVYENGDMKRVEIEKSFYDAIEDLYKNGRFGNGWDVAFDAGSKVAYPFKQLVTSWNPIFMIKNGMRDFPEAIINSRQTKEFLECMPAAMKELKSGGEFYQALRDSGVSQANFVNLEEALTSGDNLLKRGVNKFATAQELVETYPRLIEYMATIKKAGYKLEDGIKNVPMEIRDIAAANAADVTVNFGRSGSVGKAINRGLVPFFNPSVQGWSKFLRNFSEQGSTKAMLGFGVKALALGAGVQAVNNFLLEDNKNYQQISPRDKATNIIIPWTWGKDVTADNTNVFIKIPKSRFASAFSLPMVNAGNENKMGWAEMIKVAGDQVAPVDPVESNLLSPLLLASRNKTWYGTPIVPQAIENKTNPSQEYDANTSLIGKALGKATENLPTELQISPKKADYIIDAETGVLGDFGLPMLTPSKQGGGSALDKYVKHPWGNVLKRAWTIDSTTQNNLSTRFYDKLQVATDNKDKEESKRLTGYSKEIGKINTAIRTLQNGNRKTKQEDIYGLQKVRNQMMQDAIDGKEVPSEYKAMDAVQKYVGTAYAVNHFGTSADKRAMKLYGEKKYGTLSAAERRKAINEDKDFYKGVQSIGKLQGKMQKAGIDSDTTLSRAIALASVDASDDLFGAYKAQDQSRTETAHEMKRARTYFKSGGSTGEFVKLEKARKTLGKLPEEQRKDELAKLDEEFSKGKMSYAEYGKREKDINYNADISYLGLATSFALANSPERGYRVYDIKDANVRKGINLAAMGFTSRDVHKMKNDLDTDGNGYPKKQEIIDYINKGNFKDKATLFDALYSYKGKYNPFGAVTNYTRAQAAAEGKKKKVEWITDETDGINVKEEASSSGGRYYRRWGRWHRWGRSGGRKASTATPSAFNAKKSSVTSSGSKVSVPKTGSNVSVRKTTGISSGSSGSSSRRASTATSTTTTPKTSLPNVRRSASRVSTNSKMSITPLNVKTVKPKRASGGGNSNLSAALKDIENTQKKVAPPKARRK